MRLLEQHPDRINWSQLSSNQSEAAMRLLEQHQNRIVWRVFSANPSIFVYDYEGMEDSTTGIKAGVLKNRLHPDNIPKFKDWKLPGFEEDEEDE